MEYKDVLSIVEEIEKSAVKSTVSFVDLSKVETGDHGAISYEELLSKIASVYGGKIREERVQREAPKPSHIVTAGLAQAAYSQPQVYRQAQPQPQGETNQQEQLPSSAIKREKKGAKSDLESIVKKLGSVARAPSMKVRRVNVSELVLPNLTLADQISELERIIEGLRENVFDSEHLEIVKEELCGLSQVVNASNKQGRPAPKSELEESLFELRDQHLNEALALLAKVS